MDDLLIFCSLLVFELLRNMTYSSTYIVSLRFSGSINSITNDVRSISSELMNGWTDEWVVSNKALLITNLKAPV